MRTNLDFWLIKPEFIQKELDRFVIDIWLDAFGFHAFEKICDVYVEVPPYPKIVYDKLMAISKKYDLSECVVDIGWQISFSDDRLKKYATPERFYYAVDYLEKRAPVFAEMIENVIKFKLITREMLNGDLNG